MAGEDQKAGKGHDQLAGDGGNHALQGHEQKNADIAALIDEQGIVITERFSQSHNIQLSPNSRCRICCSTRDWSSLSPGLKLTG